MKQKIHDIPIWEAYSEGNTECPLCLIEKRLEKDFMDILYDDMLMTPYFAKKLQSYSFCTGHYKKLYTCKDKLGLALMVNNFLQCEKDSLKKAKGFGITRIKNSVLKLINGKIKKSGAISSGWRKQCYLCEKINDNMPDYIEVLIKLWNKNNNFQELYSKSKGHCLNHYHMLTDGSSRYLQRNKASEFNKITLNIQLDNTNRLIDELDWFVSKFDYRFQNEPWKNSKDALPRCINKLTGNFNED